MNDFYDSNADIAGTWHGSGSGTPVVLLHSLAMDRRMWTPSVLELFSAQRRLVVCDIPGHGASPLAGSETIEAIADRVVTMMDGLGLDTANIVGVSMGGCIAQAIAIHHGDRVHGLALVDTTSDYGDPAAWEKRARVARNDGFAAMAEFQASRWFSDGFRASQPEQIDRLLDIFSGMDIDSYESICRAMGAVALSGSLGSISAPTAVVVGDGDYATPVSHAEVLAALIPNATLHVIAGSSHLTVLERPEEVFQAIEPVL